MLVYTFMRTFRLIAWFSQVLLQLCHKSMKNGGHLGLWRPFSFRKPVSQGYIICNKVIYYHAKFYAFQRKFTDSILLHSINFILKCDIGGLFEFPLYFSPQRWQGVIQWILNKYTLKNMKMQKKQHIIYASAQFRSISPIRVNYFKSDLYTFLTLYALLFKQCELI